MDRGNEGIDAAHQRLVEHSLYTRLSSADDVLVFMQHHVFAVWDFFSLLKRLQRELTCVEVPWMPRPHADHARFVMEIALAEETDENVGGGYTSHFELYRRAMTEVGADRTAIDTFINEIIGGTDAVAALDRPTIAPSVRHFVGETLNVVLYGKPHEVAASFCHGRENLLPDVLTALKDGLGDVLDTTPVFKHYIERHIELDHDEHGPLALRLVNSLCEGDPQREAEANAAGVAAIEARIALWDGILEALPNPAAV